MAEKDVQAAAIEAYAAQRVLRKSQNVENKSSDWDDKDLAKYPAPHLKWINCEGETVAYLLDVIRNATPANAGTVRDAMMILAYFNLSYLKNNSFEYLFERYTVADGTDDRTHDSSSVSNKLPWETADCLSDLLNFFKGVQTKTGDSAPTPLEKPKSQEEVWKEVLKSNAPSGDTWYQEKRRSFINEGKDWGQVCVSAGLWAFFHLRCIVKDDKSMKGYEANNKFENLHVGLYQRTCEVKMPSLSVEMYKTLHNCMQIARGLVLSVLSRAVQIYYHVIAEKDPEEPYVAPVLKGGALIVLVSASVPVYNWLKKATDMFGKNMDKMELASKLVWGGVTTHTIHNLCNFVKKYEDDPTGPPSSKYYAIARLINPAYFKDLGRSNNGEFITVCYYICRALDNSENKESRYKLYQLPPCLYGDLAPKMASRVISAVKNEASTSYKSSTFEGLTIDEVEIKPVRFNHASPSIIDSTKKIPDMSMY